MKYKTDKMRIEDALPHALMLCIMKLRDGQCKEEDSPFSNVYPVLRTAIFEQANTNKLLRRLDNIVNECNKYFDRNKIKSHKAFIITTRLGMYLYYNRAIEIDKKSELYLIWRDFYYTVRDDGTAYIEGFQKLYDSAIDHVSKLLKVIQQQGYYI